ncbi:peptidase, partial [bacterium]
AIALRAGTTNLVAALIESGWKLGFELRDPVKAIKAVSRDESYKWLLDTSRGSMSAIDVQRAYWEGAKALQLPGSDWVLGEWSDALDTLERDPLELFDRCDWVAKKLLLDQFAESEDLDWTRDRLSLQSLDLAYCNVDPEAGLYQALVEDGSMQTLVSDEEIEAARDTAPQGTRALLRGALVAKFAPQIRQLSWGALETHQGTRLALPETGDFAAMREQIESATSLEELASTWSDAE